MKRIFAAVLLGFATVAAGAQNMYDGINYSETNYYGTARSIALGNAMTAVGGDLGSIGLNPAGSAVAGYSQFTVTPGFTISATNASYAPVAYGDFTGSSADSQTRFNLPNLGIVMNFDTGNSYGLLNYSFGIVSNMSNLYSDYASVSGKNSVSSMMGEAAFFSQGYECDVLGNYDSYYDTAIGWTDILSFRSGMTSVYGDDNCNYIGTTEAFFDDGSIGQAGPIRQTYYRRHTGSKSDIVMNMGFNFNNNLYFGFNLGIPTFSYNEFLSQNEAAINMDDFAQDIDGITRRFSDARQRYTLNVDGTGVYAKLGFIWLPTQNLRIGGAIKTPTLMTVTEKWLWDSRVNFDNLSGALEETPLGDYTYNLQSPFSFNLGAAYTLGGIALLTADYERVNYRSMRFSEFEAAYDMDMYAQDNIYIQQHAGSTNHYRVGAEVKVIPEFAIRAGYNRKEYYDDHRELTQAFSFGVGYSSPGSFFADCAFRYNKYPDNWYYPYEDYLEETKSPEVRIAKNVMDFVFTIGWRF